ncbi:GDSL-type esterase/lipase family protein [Mucilaginibacter sp. SP1R1]|uniref:GDSL-type esterase/lipase family protein n=1 Tax=Mucilaginibacter sp. SP1R1 TaxID=2723091 RepID=UPI00160D4D08|nr:GDSL-type esterase/lipase family protein [Mucilaginibacter sp. SP1R1]MBB6147683.1 lysophospholipase L1-like esterase [Mucilaginibacter sp. SP1R1]
MKGEQLHGKKLKWFRVLAFSIPVLLLILTELVLRLFHYGHDTSLFIRYPDDPNYWVINKYASERYFADSVNATKGSVEPFKVEKAANTFRIFVLGESTTAGYPYFHNGSFHRWLQYRLMHLYPDLNFEIVNVSLTAVNSYTVLDFGEQVVNYQPDAVLIYTGHNEYYGALGVGSTSHIANNRFLIKTVLQLRKFRLVQLIDNVIYSLSNIKGKPVNDRDNLMKRMAAKQEIALNSPEYQTGIQQFKANITELCELLHQEKIPAFLSTLVSNEKDLKPFISEPGKAKASADQEYQLANTAYAAGEYAAAKQHYIQAKEFDQLRFRAPDAMNKIITGLTEKYNNVHLVDARKVFEEHSPQQILGNETLLEHVHPNLYGYALLSDAFYNSIQAAHLIKARPDTAMSLAELVKQMPVTRVDSLYGAYTVMMLKTGWPFNVPIPAGFKRGNSMDEQLAGALSVNSISWLDAMNRLFQYSMKANDKKTALKAVEAVMLENPRNTTYPVFAARLSFDLGNLPNAVFYFKKLYQQEPTFANLQNMYLVYLKADQPGKAVPYIDQAISLQNNNPVLLRLKATVQDIIELKRKLATIKGDLALSQQIAIRYHAAGADEAAIKYEH